MKKTLAILLSMVMVFCMMPLYTGVAFAKVALTAADITATAEYDGSAITADDITVLVSGTSITTDNTKPLYYTLENTTTDPGTVENAIKVYASGSDVYDNNTSGVSASLVVSPYDLSKHYVKAYIGDQVAELTEASVTNAVSFTFDGYASSVLEAELKNALNYTTQYDSTKKTGTVSFALKSGVNFQNNIASVTYNVKTAASTLNITGKTGYSYDGNAKDPKSVVNSGSYTISFIRAELEGATVTEIKDAGTYTLYFNVSGYAGEKAVQFTLAKRDAAKYVKVADIPNQVNGVDISSIKPVVTDTIGGKTVTLVPGKDYDVVDGGIAGKINVRFSGNYSGTIPKTYKIIDSNYSLADATVVNETGSTVGNATAQTAVISVKKTVDSALKTLKEGTDFKVEYRQNGKAVTAKNAGTYEVWVIGTGSYAGEVRANKDFVIEKCPIDLCEIILKSTTHYDTYSKTYVPDVQLRHVTSKGVFEENKDYIVTYRYINSTSKYTTPEVACELIATGNLVNGVGNNKEIVKKISLASRSISLCSVSFYDGRSTVPYTLGGYLPKVTVKDTANGNALLAENTEYTLTYKDSNGTEIKNKYLVDAGTYSVIVTGQNGYSGTTTLTFTITGTAISNFTVELKEYSVNADGYAHTPVITSVRSGLQTVPVTDYTVSYKNPDGKTITASEIKVPGTYQVIVTGKNGYTGTTSASYRIVGIPQTITGVGFSEYTGNVNSEELVLGAKCSTTALTYSSSNPAVASVDKNGYVTLEGVGVAKITVKAAANGKYEEATKVVTVTVKPLKQVIKSASSPAKGKLKVSVKKQAGVERYQIRYSYSDSKVSSKYGQVYINDNPKYTVSQAKTINKSSYLKSGKYAYVKVRAVYTNADGKTAYGTWSTVKKVKIK